MSDEAAPRTLLEDLHEQLETAPTLVDFIHHLDIARILQKQDYESFKKREYDPEPIARALLCRDLGGFSWKGLYEYLSTDARATRLGFDSEKFGKYNTAPTRQTLTNTWDSVFSDATKRSVLTVSERLVKDAHENPDTLNLRAPKHIEANKSDLRERYVGEFSNEQICKKVRLARDVVFGVFDSGRAENVKYHDSRFDEFQAFMSLLACDTPQGQSRMENFFGENYTPHGDTHLRTVKKYSEDAIKNGFEKSIENLLNAIDIQILQPPVTVAIDITTWDYHAEDGLPPEVSGTKDGEGKAYKFATLSLVGKSMPVVLAYEPVIESSEWDDNPKHRYHRTVRKLISRAKELVNIDLVLADRGFESWKVYQTLDNANVNYLLPKIERSDELECIERMEREGEEVAVELGKIEVEQGSHVCRVLYVPGRDDETQSFITNERIDSEDAEAWVKHYAYRWCIEDEYRSIKQEFLAKTCSKDHELRIYYFVFGILMYNVWRLTNVLLKASVSEELTDYTPVVTAGELADWVAIHIQLEPD